METIWKPAFKISFGAIFRNRCFWPVQGRFRKKKTWSWSDIAHILNTRIILQPDRLPSNRGRKIFFWAISGGVFSGPKTSSPKFSELERVPKPAFLTPFTHIFPEIVDFDLFLADSKIFPSRESVSHNFSSRSGVGLFSSRILFEFFFFSVYMGWKCTFCYQKTWSWSVLFDTSGKYRLSRFSDNRRFWHILVRSRPNSERISSFRPISRGGSGAEIFSSPIFSEFWKSASLIKWRGAENDHLRQPWKGCHSCSQCSIFKIWIFLVSWSVSPTFRTKFEIFQFIDFEKFCVKRSRCALSQPVQNSYPPLVTSILNIFSLCFRHIFSYVI